MRSHRGARGKPGSSQLASELAWAGSGAVAPDPAQSGHQDPRKLCVYTLLAAKTVYNMVYTVCVTVRLFNNKMQQSQSVVNVVGQQYNTVWGCHTFWF